MVRNWRNVATQQKGNILVKIMLNMRLPLTPTTVFADKTTYIKLQDLFCFLQYGQILASINYTIQPWSVGKDLVYYFIPILYYLNPDEGLHWPKHVACINKETLLKNPTTNQSFFVGSGSTPRLKSLYYFSNKIFQIFRIPRETPKFRPS